MSGRKTRRPPKCPHCGSTEVIPILYGYPGDEMLEQLHRGEIALGGCCITDDQPNWRCKKCEHGWA